MISVLSKSEAEQVRVGPMDKLERLYTFTRGARVGRPPSAACRPSASRDTAAAGTWTPGVTTGKGCASSPLPEADLDAHYADAYGIFAGPATETAVLRVAPHRARWVADEVWHPRQSERFGEDGSYELRVPYGRPEDLVLDVLRLGPDAKVLAPATLREEVAKRLRAVSALYDERRRQAVPVGRARKRFTRSIGLHRVEQGRGGDLAEWAPDFPAEAAGDAPFPFQRAPIWSSYWPRGGWRWTSRTSPGPPDNVIARRRPARRS